MKHMQFKIAVALFFTYFLIRFGWAWVLGGLLLLFGKDNRMLQAVGLALVIFAVLVSLIEAAKGYISMKKVMKGENPFEAMFGKGHSFGDPGMYDKYDFDEEIEKGTREIFEMPEALPGRRSVERLREEINDASTIEECVSAFEKECETQLDPDETILFECGTFPWNKNQFSFTMTRQFPDGQDEFFQVTLEVLYESDEKNQKLFETAWDEQLKENIFDYIRRSKAYQYAQENKSAKIRIYITQT